MKGKTVAADSCAPPQIRWAVATRPQPEETASGDAYLVRPVPEGVLVAAIDGLGHGPQAELPAQRATEVLGEARFRSLADLVRQCHQQLRDTRGVAMSLALFHAEQDLLSWIGVGNVEGLLVRKNPAGRPQRLLQARGIVGHNLPRLQPATLPLQAGDLLALATDGIECRFANEVRPHQSPEQLVDRILEGFHNRGDDALVLIVQYTGGAP